MANASIRLAKEAMKGFVDDTEADDQGTDGDNQTALEWNVPSILVGNTWKVAFRVSSNRLGYQLANVVDLSRVDYLD